ncbi:MAG TPA: 2'-5' RNA ligase family protein, partial [Labilithrix sp.]|nr:2'-5' RNA ligase family protein [Labilithrix sp.]
IHAPGGGLEVLTELAAEVERAVVSLGLPAEPRPFRPHLTLARLRRPTDLREVMTQSFTPIVGHVRSITLYRSVTGHEGPTYTSLARSILGD